MQGVELTGPGQKRNSLPHTANGKPIFARNADGAPVCGKKKKDGTLCGSTVTMSNGRCRLHGGGAPMDLSHTRNSRASRLLTDLPKHLRKAYMASINDPDQVNLEAEIAVVDTNTRRLVQQLKEGSADGTVFDRLAFQMPIVEALLLDADPDPYELRREFEKLQRIVTLGANEPVIWTELQTNLELRRRLAETDQKRRLAHSKVLQAKEVDALVFAILGIVRRFEPNTKIRASIGREVLALVTPREAAQVSVIADEMESEEEIEEPE